MTSLTGKTLVIKVGGDAIANRTLLSNLARDLAELAEARITLVVVHGGGPQATELTRRLKLTPRLIGGRRITDRETLEVMKMVLAGQVQVDMLAALRRAGVRAVGLSGVSHRVIEAVKRPPRVVDGCGEEPVDFGHVGDITGINVELLRLLGEAGYVPVIAPLGTDGSGKVYNINADIVANRVALELKAERLIHVTSTPGVLADPDDPASRIPRLTVAEARRAISEGRIGGGMIPKLTESFATIEAGVADIHILMPAEPGSVVRELAEPGLVGTLISAGE